MKTLAIEANTRFEQGSLTGETLTKNVQEAALLLKKHMSILPGALKERVEQMTRQNTFNEPREPRPGRGLMNSFEMVDV
ncbi:hypothetical protein N7456_002441 [Penicillium angulare]|uniref:Uncharacterized protein n=1 Tax=Penicillium angulare TaxID=116970 RepID=A0A9W9G8E7_9EURO|nr:hypothetical protein N7456_002441 [Penicillium angulare]